MAIRTARRTTPGGSDHCPAMKGIETCVVMRRAAAENPRSDHCPAMKGIETRRRAPDARAPDAGSDHCPAMKGIET